MNVTVKINNNHSLCVSVSVSCSYNDPSSFFQSLRYFSCVYTLMLHLHLTPAEVKITFAFLTFLYLECSGEEKKWLDYKFTCDYTYASLMMHQHTHWVKAHFLFHPFRLLVKWWSLSYDFHIKCLLLLPLLLRLLLLSLIQSVLVLSSSPIQPLQPHLTLHSPFLPLFCLLLRLPHLITATFSILLSLNLSDHLLPHAWK